MNLLLAKADPLCAVWVFSETCSQGTARALPAPPAAFLPGNAKADTLIDISDRIFTQTYLFLGGPSPAPPGPPPAPCGRDLTRSPADLGCAGSTHC